jgi:serine protease Do
MKRLFIPVLALGLIALSPLTMLAQDQEKVEKKERKEVREKKEAREKKESKDKLEEYDEIIIRQKKGDADSKVVVEIRDGEVIVNGDPIEKFDDENVSVRKRKARIMALTAPSSPFRNDGGWQEFNREFRMNDNRAMLGVTTEVKDGGVSVVRVTENSAAAKAGIKEGDIITRVDEIKIEKPQDLVEAIGKYKPEEKVTVTYKRDGKENKATATLGKREGEFMQGMPGPEFRVMPKMENFNFDFDMDGLQGFGPNGPNMRPRLGIRAQDTEDGKGVKVLEVHDESAAEKAGIKEDDVILEFDGKAVNSADQLISASREAGQKSSFNIKLSRDGKTHTVEVKIPKKLKTANL